MELRYLSPSIFYKTGRKEDDTGYREKKGYIDGLEKEIFQHVPEQKTESSCDRCGNHKIEKKLETVFFRGLCRHFSAKGNSESITKYLSDIPIIYDDNRCSGSKVKDEIKENRHVMQTQKALKNYKVPGTAYWDELSKPLQDPQKENVGSLHE